MKRGLVVLCVLENNADLNYAVNAENSVSSRLVCSTTKPRARRIVRQPLISKNTLFEVLS